MVKRLKECIFSLLILGFLAHALGGVVLAATQSENYGLPAESTDAGGLISQSENYQIQGEFLGGLGTGESTSENYNVYAGEGPAFFYILSTVGPNEVFIGTFDLGVGNNITHQWNDSEVVYIQDIRMLGGASSGWSMTGVSTNLTSGGSIIPNSNVIWNTWALNAIPPASNTGVALGAGGNMNAVVSVANAGYNYGRGVYQMWPLTTIYIPGGASSGSHTGVIYLTIT